MSDILERPEGAQLMLCQGGANWETETIDHHVAGCDRMEQLHEFAPVAARLVTCWR